MDFSVAACFDLFVGQDNIVLVFPCYLTTHL